MVLFSEYQGSGGQDTRAQQAASKKIDTGHEALLIADSFDTGHFVRDFDCHRRFGPAAGSTLRKPGPDDGEGAEHGEDLQDASHTRRCCTFQFKSNNRTCAGRSALSSSVDSPSRAAASPPLSFVPFNCTSPSATCTQACR